MRAVSVDPRAASGFAAATAYERGRPSYPEGLVATVARELGVTPASTVLDVAAGTGKLTRRLAPLAGQVIAVEPSQGMLTELRRQLPAVKALAGTAEAIPLPDDSVDAVFVAEAFHWFRTAEACGEIARVLSRRGGLAVLSNRACWGEQEHPWHEAFGALTGPHREAAGPFPAGDGRWRLALEEDPSFGPLSHAEVEHVHRIGADDFVALVASWSWIANLPAPRRAALLQAVRELLAGQAELALAYRTEAYWTRRT